MRNLIKGTIVAAALVAAVPAYAQWRGAGAVAGGLAAGAIIGGALGSGYGYGYGYGPGYYDGGGPGYYGPAYDQPYAGPVYEGRSVATEPAPGAGGSVAYCEQRFHSYDPASGTYMGYDGLRHPCP